MEDLERDRSDQYLYCTQRTRYKFDYFYIDNELFDSFEYSSFNSAKTIEADHVSGVM